MSMNMIVTTKEVFQLKKYVQKRKNNVCSGLLLNEESSPSPPPCTRSRLQGIRYLSSSVVMMGPINHNDDVIMMMPTMMPTIMMLTIMMNTNGND